MFDFRLGFEEPRFLWLLLCLPVLWWISFRRLLALGGVRRYVVLAVRTAVVLAIVAALAGVQLVWVTDRVTVIYLLDQSDSIPVEQRRHMLDFALQTTHEHRNRARQDRVGLIVFGREAAVEVPAFEDDLPLLRMPVQVPGGTDATNLEAALKLAQAAMPEDSRRRVVLISDGSETIGDAQAVAARLAGSGIGVDVIPVTIAAAAEVLVEKIDLPNEIRKGQPFEARVVVTNDAADPEQSAHGRLSITRRVGGETQLLFDQPVELSAGKNVFPLRHQIDQPAAYTYEARFIPDSETDDAIAENNLATAYTHVRGQGRVLLIEPWDAPGGYRLLVDCLADADIEVVVQPSNALFGSLAELQAYDAVILAGVPRTSGDSATSITSFTDEQVEMLVRNTQQLGCGLLMLGGPEALGAGGWAGTRLEEAMPVDFDVKNLKVSATGALQLVLDTSGSMQGEKIQLCKAAAMEAVKALQENDSIGVMTFSTEVREVVPLQRVGGRSHILPSIARIGADGGTDMFPAMEKGFLRLQKSDASTKHMIVITDGQTHPNDFRSLTLRMKDEGITVTAVAVGADADVNLMREIASLGGGKLYQVLSPRAIPKILMREARRVSRGVIHEDSAGFVPEVTYPHAVLSGIQTPLQPLTGFVMTTPKDNPLVQTLILSPVPQGQVNAVLALWQYGLGRAAVLTTDAGQRWATRWATSPDYEPLFSQLVRWLMRPTGDSGNFNVATQTRDGEVQVIVNALDPNDDFLNFLPMNASVLGPDLQPIPLQLRQTAPGRYTGAFPADAAGNYFVNIVPEPGAEVLTTGVTVPYSDEYRRQAINQPLLQALAATRPRGGEAGEMLPPLENAARGEVVFDPFRGGLVSDRSIRDVWSWAVLIGCCLFLGDVFVRRVAVSFAWVNAVLKTAPKAAEDGERLVRIDHLRASKEQLTAAYKASQGAARFEPEPGQPVATTPRHDGLPEPLPDSSSSADNAWAAQPEEKSYTERLLEAKRRTRSRL